MAKSFTAAHRDEYLTHLRNGMMRGAAAELLGYERHVVDGYVAEHPEYAARVRDAEQDALEHVEEALYQAAVSGNVTAARIWIERHDRRSKGQTDPVTDDLRRELEGI